MGGRRDKLYDKLRKAYDTWIYISGPYGRKKLESLSSRLSSRKSSKDEEKDNKSREDKKTV